MTNQIVEARRLWANFLICKICIRQIIVETVRMFYRARLPERMYSPAKRADIDKLSMS